MGKFWLILIAVVPLAWVGIYRYYIRSTLSSYTRYIELNKVTLQSQVLNKIARIYFIRYQSYEISAYLILGMSVITLGVCIYVFLFANTLIAMPEAIKNPSEEFVLVIIISIRTGIALIIFFITRVLLKLYNYCLQLSVLYMSRFDAIFWVINDKSKDLARALDFTAVTMPTDKGVAAPKIDEPLLEVLRGYAKPK